jgi:hypothetical protein
MASRLSERVFGIEFAVVALAVCLGRLRLAVLDWRLVVGVRAVALDFAFAFDLRVFELEEADLIAANAD